jgi:hypothetical protein
MCRQGNTEEHRPQAASMQFWSAADATEQSQLAATGVGMAVPLTLILAGRQLLS